MSRVRASSPAPFAMIITRDIICKNIVYDVYGKKYNYNDITKQINQWKRLLLGKYNAKKGNVLALCVFIPDVTYLSILIAAAELGLKVIVLDWPLKKETINKTKIALFGPADFTIETNNHRKMYPLHHLMTTTYSKVVINTSEVANIDNSDISHEYPNENDIFIIGSTSGSTKQSRKVEFCHSEIYSLVKRNIKVFEFNEDSKVLHIENIHHASNVFVHYLPSLNVSKNHFCFFTSVSEFVYSLDKTKDVYKIMNQYIQDNNISHLSVKNIFQLINLLKHDIVYNIQLTISLSGFTLPEYFLDLCKKHNLKFISHYGSIDTGIPLLVNYMNNSSKFTSKSLGICPDDLYSIKLGDVVNISSKLWKNERTLSDSLDFNGEVFLHKGRIDQDHDIDTNGLPIDFVVVLIDNKRHLVVWEEINYEKYAWYDTKELLQGAQMQTAVMAVYNKNLRDFETVSILNKKDFTDGTKVNMDQLKEFIRAKK